LSKQQQKELEVLMATNKDFNEMTEAVLRGAALGTAEIAAKNAELVEKVHNQGREYYSAQRAELTGERTGAAVRNPALASRERHATQGGESTEGSNASEMTHLLLTVGLQNREDCDALLNKGIKTRLDLMGLEKTDLEDTGLLKPGALTLTSKKNLLKFISMTPENKTACFSCPKGQASSVLPSAQEANPAEVCLSLQAVPVDDMRADATAAASAARPLSSPPQDAMPTSGDTAWTNPADAPAPNAPIQVF